MLPEIKTSLDVLNKINDYIPIISCDDKSSETIIVIPSDIRVQAVNIFDSCVLVSNDDIKAIDAQIESDRKQIDQVKSQIVISQNIIRENTV